MRNYRTLTNRRLDPIPNEFDDLQIHKIKKKESKNAKVNILSIK